MASAKAGDQHPGRAHPAGRGEAAPADEPRPDHPVARPELLPPERPRPAARLGQRPGEAQRLRPDRRPTPSWPAAASACASSARRSSRRSAARRSIPPGPCPAACASALSEERRDHLRRPAARGAGDGPGRPGPLQEHARQLPGGGARRSATFPRCSWAWSARTAAGSTTTAVSASWTATGKIVADDIDPARYAEYIGEAVEPDSYLKSPYFRPLGYPDGVYRVGPLARLNVCDRMGTPLADRELAEFRQRGGRTVNVVVLLPLRPPDRDPGRDRAHRAAAGRPGHARRTDLRAEAGVNRLEGVGVSEAPRGTLFHHYQVDENGLLKKVNLIIATGQNNLAMNRTVAQIAQHYIRGAEDPRGDAEPRRGRHPRLRPVPELLDARRRPDAADRAADRARRRGRSTRCDANDRPSW